MVGIWIRKMTGVRWPVALMRVLFLLAVWLLIGALTPAAVAAPGNHRVAQAAGTTVSATPVEQPATYRYTAQPDGTTQVQRSQDGGLTWLAAGMIPEVVAQLAVNPANDTAVFARTGKSL